MNMNKPFETTSLPLTDEDLLLISKIHKKYGERIANLDPLCIITFVQGYANLKDRETETFKKIDYYLEQNEKYDFGSICLKPMKNEKKYLETWPLYIYGYDKQSHPVLYDEVGEQNTKELHQTFDNHEEDLKLFRYRVIHRLQNIKRIQSTKLGMKGEILDNGCKNMIQRHCIVMDIKKCGVIQVNQFKKLIKDVLDNETHLWPNTLHHLFFINTTFAFRMAWAIISKFVDKVTRDKVKVFGYNYIQDLTKYIDINMIPTKYRGEGEWDIELGYAPDIKKEYQDGDFGSLEDLSEKIDK